MQNGENYYKMEVIGQFKQKWLRLNIWWFVAICTVCVFAFFAIFAICERKSGETSESSGYPLAPLVAIDAGHGGIDRGASGFGLFESDINLAVATMLEKSLSTLNIQTVMTRTGDYGLYGTTDPGFKKRDMLERKNIVESSGASALISIHMNASSITDRTGVVIYCDFENESSLLLANSIASGFESAKVKDGDFFITTKIDTPAVIVECGFITTPSEAYQLGTSEYQEYLANCIARGVLIYQRNLQEL